MAATDFLCLVDYHSPLFGPSGRLLRQIAKRAKEALVTSFFIALFGTS